MARTDAFAGQVATINPEDPLSDEGPIKLDFFQDFRRFFLRGLAALLPTLITLSVLVYVWNFLWQYLGQHLIYAVKYIWWELSNRGLIAPQQAGFIGRSWREDQFSTRLVGVLLAIIAVYIVGLLVGNLIGRTIWKLGEVFVMKVPVIRAIYPAVKQVTDFVLQERKQQFLESRVVAVQPHEKGIWSIGLVTGPGLKPLNDMTKEEMVTVFVPSSPTAFSGYVMIAPRSSVIELPMSVEEAMRMLISGGVIVPGSDPTVPRTLKELASFRQAPIPKPPVPQRIPPNFSSTT